MERSLCCAPKDTLQSPMSDTNNGTASCSLAPAIDESHEVRGQDSAANNGAKAHASASPLPKSAIQPLSAEMSLQPSSVGNCTPLYESFRVPRQNRMDAEEKISKIGAWDISEQRAFLHGLICFGWGRWKEIGTLVTSRYGEVHFPSRTHCRSMPFCSAQPLSIRCGAHST